MPEHLIGVISDTHGLLRPQALQVLAGVELILHAGDVGTPQVLETLRQVAPVTAVRGNTDRGEWGHSLPHTAIVEVGEARLYVLHDLHRLDLDPAAAGFAAVIFGHSHQPYLQRRNQVLYLNPGSAGPRRFTLPVSLARLHLQGDSLQAELVELQV
jgi:putative phosphoesterase